MIRFRIISSLPYKAKSIPDLNKKIESWNSGNWSFLGYGSLFKTPKIPEEILTLPGAKKFLIEDVERRKKLAERDEEILGLLKKELDFIDYIL